MHRSSFVHSLTGADGLVYRSVFLSEESLVGCFSAGGRRFRWKERVSLGTISRAPSQVFSDEEPLEVSAVFCGVVPFERDLVWAETETVAVTSNAASVKTDIRRRMMINIPLREKRIVRGWRSAGRVTLARKKEFYLRSEFLGKAFLLAYWRSRPMGACLAMPLGGQYNPSKK